MHALRSTTAVLALLLLPAAATAQPEPPAAESPAGAAARDPSAAIEDAEPESPLSPRAALREFLDRARRGAWDEAAAYLDADAVDAESRRLARRLKAVLAAAWVEPTGASALAAGAPDDGLPRGVDEVAQVPGISGAREPVRMRRNRAADGPAWVFTAETVARIDDWHSRLPGSVLLERLPEPLLRTGPGGLQWWQWIALLPTLLLAWLAGALFSAAMRAVLRRAAARTGTAWDDQMAAGLRGPITLAWSLVAARALLALLSLPRSAASLFGEAIEIGFLVTLFWALLRAASVAGRAIIASRWAFSQPVARSLVPMGVKAARVAIAAIGVVAVLSALGYPVASLIAGLGIGGVAIALAAQKTVENLFGSVSLGVDQPFRVGDFVNVEGVVGNVEVIGLRSTRIRTLDRTLVTIPNGKLADLRIESFQARDRMRLATIIGLDYRTTASQLREVVEGFERVLRTHPKIWPDAMVVKLGAFGESSLDIEIMAWFQVPEWKDFQACRHEVLIAFMEVVEQAGTSFAFPTRTVFLAREGEPVAPA